MVNYAINNQKFSLTTVSKLFLKQPKQAYSPVSIQAKRSLNGKYLI